MEEILRSTGQDRQHGKDGKGKATEESTRKHREIQVLCNKGSSKGCNKDVIKMLDGLGEGRKYEVTQSVSHVSEIS